METAPHLTHPSEVRKLLESLDFHPSRILGQNFLIDANILNIMIHAAGVEPDDVVLEVGPGLGVLTEALLPRVSRVVAIEKDHRLAAYLRERLAGAVGLRLLESDVLDVDLARVVEDERITHCVSNLPYAVGTRFLVNLMGLDRYPRQITVTVQREVAERLVARTGTHAYGLVSVLAQWRYAVAICKNIRPTCFYPPPEVDSSIVCFQKLEQPVLPTTCWAHGLQLLKTCFGHRRKQMGSILRPYATQLAAAGFNLNVRPEHVTPSDWARWTQSLSPFSAREA